MRDRGKDSRHSRGQENAHARFNYTINVDHLVLWRLRGSLDELACAVRTTAYGYTLGLELAGEPILLELQSNVDTLVDKAARLETWLLKQGWERIPDEQVMPF